ncbi:hypothetical protein H0H92_013229, partial [Tricholoma furcatifolium]
MPLRSSTKSTTTTNRLSAVYIGPHPSIIPDLPDPPRSPNGSGSDSDTSEHDNSRRNASGLPSPPGTNSTGSGGGSTADGERSLPSELESFSLKGPRRLHTHTHRPSSSITSIASISTITRGQGGSIFEEALALPQDEEEDETARLDVRVRNLTQKNRLVLDKLGGGKQSPAPSTSSSTSSRRSAAAAAVLPAHDPRSGSETERESTFSRGSGSSHHRALSLADPPHEPPATHRTRVPSEPGL